jgi:hypothetical protein
MIELVDVDGEMFDVLPSSIKYVEVLATPIDKFPTARLYVGFRFGGEVISSFLADDTALDQLGLAVDRDVPGWVRLTNTDGNTVFLAIDVIGERKSKGDGARIWLTHSGLPLDVTAPMAELRAKVAAAGSPPALPASSPTQPPRKRAVKGVH